MACDVLLRFSYWKQIPRWPPLLSATCNPKSSRSLEISLTVPAFLSSTLCVVLSLYTFAVAFIFSSPQDGTAGVVFFGFIFIVVL